MSNPPSTRPFPMLASIPDQFLQRIDLQPRPTLSSLARSFAAHESQSITLTISPQFPTPLSVPMVVLILTEQLLEIHSIISHLLLYRQLPISQPQRSSTISRLHALETRLLRVDVLLPELLAHKGYTRLRARRRLEILLARILQKDLWEIRAELETWQNPTLRKGWDDEGDDLEEEELEFLELPGPWWTEEEWRDFEEGERLGRMEWRVTRGEAKPSGGLGWVGRFFGCACGRR